MKTDKESYQEIAEIKDAMLRIEGWLWQLEKVISRKENGFIEQAKTEIDFMKRIVEKMEERANKLLIKENKDGMD